MNSVENGSTRPSKREEFAIQMSINDSNQFLLREKDFILNFGEGKFLVMHHTRLLASKTNSFSRKNNESM